jgi:transposase-like protein
VVKLLIFIYHRQEKYLNNAVDADRGNYSNYGKLKRLIIHPVRGSKSMKMAYATIKRFEVMHIFKRPQFKM